MYKSQSAMEYLMTYGWAILIIAVVLAVLFQLGVFSGGNFLPHAQAGSCQVSRTVAGTSLEGQCNGMLPLFVAQFNGQSSYMTFNNPTFEDHSFTVALWIYPTVQNAGHFQIFIASSGASGCTTDNALLLGTNINTDNSNYYMAFDSDDIQNPANVFTANRWYFVTATWNSSTKARMIYLNASQNVAPGTSVGVLNTGSNYVSVGAGQGTCWGGYFNGDIANMQLYNTSLSQQEVQALYLEGIGGAPIRPQNVVGWWPLNGNANDYSGNNNNGQLNSVTFSSSWEGSYTTP